MGEATYFIDNTAKIARQLEVVDASFVNGMNLAGSNACGIGINMNGGSVVGTAAQFTLLDQRGLTREAQLSQHIGGSGLGDGAEGFAPSAVIRFGTAPTEAAKESDPALDGTVVSIGNSTLTSLAAGWVTNV
jgi:hypothetical protein